jgi:CHASE3 domain sensor protein
MIQKTFIRLFLLVMLIFASMFLFSYARLHKTTKECSEAEKCEQQQNPTESIIWEAFSHNLLSCR